MADKISAISDNQNGICIAVEIIPAAIEET